MFRDRFIPQEGGGRFWGVLLKIKNDATKLLQQIYTPPRTSPYKPSWQRPVLLRQGMLFAITLANFGMISVLLMVNSPKELVTTLSVTAPSLQNLTSVNQVTAHFLSFYVLTILLCLCFRNAGYFIPAIFMVGYAVFTELFQGLLPARHTDIFDLLTNSMGIACGVFSVWTITLIQERHWLRQFHSGAFVTSTKHGKLWKHW